MHRNRLKMAVLMTLAASLTACNASGGSNGSGTPSNSESHGAANASSHSNEHHKIVYSAFWPNKQVEEAIQAYEAEHPNIDVEMKYGLSTAYSDDEGDPAQTNADMEKYITSTNAAMLSGKGPDLIDLRYLSAEDFMDRKLLDDLGGRMKQDHAFDSAHYFTHVLESGRSDQGGPYSIPLTFSLSGMAGDQAAIAKTGVKINDKDWSWNDFQTVGRQLLAAKGPYKTVISNGEGMIAAAGPDFFVRSIVSDYYDSFVNEGSRKASFDTGTFAELLTQLKGMFDEGIIASGRAYFSNVSIASPTDYLTSLKMFGEDTVFYMKPHSTGAAAGVAFTPSYNLGINANSKVKDEAWELLKYLMDHTSIGFPINKAQFADAVQKLKDQGTIATDARGPLQGKPLKVDAAKLDLLESFADHAVHHANDSGKVLDIVVAESAAFFAGQKSAQDVARLIQNKATTYLNE